MALLNRLAREALITVVGLAAPAVTALADVGVEVAAGDQIFPRIAGRTEADGFFPNCDLVVWQDQRVGAPNIYARRITPGGAAVGGLLIVDESPAATLMPSVAYDSLHGIFFIVWEDRTAHKIRGRFLNTAGVFLGFAFDIATAGTPGARPDVAWNRVSDRWLVVWQESHGASGSDIQGQLCTDVGPVGATFTINGEATEEKRAALAARMFGAEFMVVWDRSFGAAANPNSIRGQRVGAAGALIGGVIDVSLPRATPQGVPSIAIDTATERYLVTFTDRRNGAAWQLDVRGQFLDAVGVRIDNPSTAPVENNGVDHFLIAGVGRGATNQQLSRVAFASAPRRFAIVWEDDWFGVRRVRGREIDANNGAIFGVEIAVSDPAAGGVALTPAIAYHLDSNSLFMVWADGRAAAPRDVFGRQVVP